MNIILIGNNGAGKSTIANRFYKQGYHVLKEGPRGSSKFHAAFATLCLTDYHLVFDRWNVVDRLIYEKEEQYLDLIRHSVDQVNRNNVIIYMVNETVPYYNEEDPTRSIQRPDLKTKLDLDNQYEAVVNKLHKLGFIIYLLVVRPDEQDTFQVARAIVKSHEYLYRG